MKNIALFGSGAGTNAGKIIDYFRGSETVKVDLVVCNKPGAGILSIAEDKGISTLLIEKDRFLQGDAYVPYLREYEIDLIVLAGFLWKLPPLLIQAFPLRIVNIHPALLPRFGGKGMYGHRVHEAVIASGEKETGITIHFVDELYDHGGTIFQAKCPVSPTDNAAMLAEKVQKLEHEHYPVVIERILQMQRRG